MISFVLDPATTFPVGQEWARLYDLAGELPKERWMAKADKLQEDMYKKLVDRTAPWVHQERTNSNSQKYKRIFGESEDYADIKSDWQPGIKPIPVRLQPWCFQVCNTLQIGRYLVRAMDLH